MIDYRGWRHTFKLDPDKSIDDEALEAICESGTDGIIVGGTYGVTFDNTLDLMSRIRRYAVPAVLEISSLDAVVPGFDSYLIPLVINAGDPAWIFSPHVSGLKEYGSYIHWDDILTEGYLIANPDAGVAQLTKAHAIENAAEAKAYAQVATKICRLPIVYMEYSGAYGDPEIVRACRAGAEGAHLFYGGGIRTPEQAAEMADIADTVVVGNVIYDDLQAALSTVKAVKG
ncbi:heptaprenylglyceryl phosphate synthase [Brevibacillus choshinensis]|uniref:heptaprenylglyceryl phosphate synthase n=1 Tax=Brevibacillus choshinensis TaxID=54911 RepID=UPI002E20AC7B|nr:heptaprenylglyceryl phosphate synthase [Brevibacillus choshinensis]MED4585316.1 heptaprenylglyceryl phosphate synthase [Brevibacillus choshinensis]MED4752462.1 heptaprenylglyceryl phosphate synthase [Brevibacillus choshinensis]MED4785053.1 heptaprenylglyceryl phosphate synthase [Brevibacillus choshinensis]